MRIAPTGQDRLRMITTFTGIVWALQRSYAVGVSGISIDRVPRVTLAASPRRSPFALLSDAVGVKKRTFLGRRGGAKEEMDLEEALVSACLTPNNVGSLPTAFAKAFEVFEIVRVCLRGAAGVSDHDPGDSKSDQ